MSLQSAVPFGNGGKFTESRGIWVQIVEHVAAGVEKIDFMGGDQRTERPLIIADESRHAAVMGRIGVNRDVDAFDDGILQAKCLRPFGKHPHDGGLRGGDPDEV